MSQLNRILAYCISEGVPKRSLGVSLVVGSVLNLINQGDSLLDGADLDVLKIVLTYVVPYCVATYGAVSYRIGEERSRITERRERISN